VIGFIRSASQVQIHLRPSSRRTNSCQIGFSSTQFISISNGSEKLVERTTYDAVFDFLGQAARPSPTSYMRLCDNEISIPHPPVSLHPTNRLLRLQ
jgi:hypothetical protein